MDTKAQYSHEQVLKVVEAKNSILEEIQVHLQQSNIRTESIVLMDEAIPWVAAELFRGQKQEMSIEVFTKEFKRDVVRGSRREGVKWEYFSGKSEAHIGLRLLPSEKSVFFGIVPDESGKHILSYRYIAV